MNQARLLVAGIGNIFMGDDAFGVEVVRELSQRPLPDEVRVVDFGIRGIDLTYALLDGYGTVILVDAVPRGGQPGTLYTIEPDMSELGDESAPAVMIDTHNLDPVKVLRLSRSLGGRVERVLLVGCEPTPLPDGDDFVDGLSKPVRAAIEPAVKIIEDLLAECLASDPVVVARGTVCGNQS